MYSVMLMLAAIAGTGSANTFICNNGPPHFNQPDNGGTDARLADLETRVQQLQLLLDQRGTGYTTIQGVPRGW